ncbi:PREDICTED: uncharacterized protein LOC104613194 [Nelumbo nucifera]|uniref:Uncharacterized protein n=2 Tax=Nelumbo nucifera TaxID=4432 RepID=A0A822XHX0_NELNU|nr:PREDICTED: uncharacterized protein LOC104613194 [Nelumbo nucifera]DAD21094.1 TPA_asm: hypothetical protein HUJ06_022557 [Nelumbo nucifera]
MGFQKEYLDLILVPSGLLIMFGYHLFLLYRILRYPETTVIGYENHNRIAWVERMMQVESSDLGLALSVISSNTSAATFLCSVSIGLSSLIGAWVGSSSHNLFANSLIYGDTSESTMSIKYISILSFFLVAFTAFVQAARYFVHTTFLITMPYTDMPVKYVQMAVTRGSYYWSVGLRALYFAVTLLLWIFGPIPMFATSVIMVMLLHIVDSNSHPLHQYKKLPLGRGRGRIMKVGQEMANVVRAVGEEMAAVGEGMTAAVRGIEQNGRQEQIGYTTST